VAGIAVLGFDGGNTGDPIGTATQRWHVGGVPAGRPADTGGNQIGPARALRPAQDECRLDAARTQYPLHRGSDRLGSMAGRVGQGD